MRLRLRVSCKYFRFNAFNLVQKNQHPTDLAFWRDRLYYTDKYSKHVLSVGVENVTRDGNSSLDQVESFGPTLFFQPESIHIYSQATASKGTTCYFIDSQIRIIFVARNWV